MDENFKIKAIRDEIRKRIEAELKFEKDLPLHRKVECESILYLCDVYDRYDGYNLLKVEKIEKGGEEK